MSQYDNFLEAVSGLDKNLISNSKYKFVELVDTGVIFIFDLGGNLLDTFNDKLRLEQRMTEEELRYYEEYKIRLNKSMSVKEVNKYGNLLNELLDNVKLRVEREMYWLD